MAIVDATQRCCKVSHCVCMRLLVLCARNSLFPFSLFLLSTFKKVLYEKASFLRVPLTPFQYYLDQCVWWWRFKKMMMDDIFFQRESQKTRDKFPKQRTWGRFLCACWDSLKKRTRHKFIYFISFSPLKINFLFRSLLERCLGGDEFHSVIELRKAFRMCCAYLCAVYICVASLGCHHHSSHNIPIGNTLTSLLDVLPASSYSRMFSIFYIYNRYFLLMSFSFSSPFFPFFLFL